LLGGLDGVRFVAELRLLLQRVDDDDHQQPGGDPVVAVDGRPERPHRRADRPPAPDPDLPVHRRRHLPGAHLHPELQLPRHPAGGERPLAGGRAMRAGGRWAGRVLLAAVAVLIFVGLGPVTGAYRLATVLSGSMAPGMPVGSVAVLVPEPPAAVRVG